MLGADNWEKEKRSGGETLKQSQIKSVFSYTQGMRRRAAKVNHVPLKLKIFFLNV